MMLSLQYCFTIHSLFTVLFQILDQLLRPTFPLLLLVTRYRLAHRLTGAGAGAGAGAGTSDGTIVLQHSSYCLF